MRKSGKKMLRKISKGPLPVRGCESNNGALTGELFTAEFQNKLLQSRSCPKQDDADYVFAIIWDACEETHAKIGA